MLKQLIHTKNASLIYECNMEQIERQISEECLTKEEILKLYEILSEHKNKLDSFKYVLRKLIF